MEIKDYRPVFRVGGTVWLKPEFQRTGYYVSDLQSFQPYRVTKLDMKRGRISVVTSCGPREFSLYAFDPVSNGYALYDKVRIKHCRRGYSSIMQILEYKDRKYRLSNGEWYSTDKISKHTDFLCNDNQANATTKVEQQILQL